MDDRYLIMNAGDELRWLRGGAAAAAGIVRDFVLVGDGWVKDGDFNTTFSRTVLPLPTHPAPRYDTAAGRLEDDPVYRRHARDFERRITRATSRPTAPGTRFALRSFRPSVTPSKPCTVPPGSGLP